MRRIGVTAMPVGGRQITAILHLESGPRREICRWAWRGPSSGRHPYEWDESDTFRYFVGGTSDWNHLICFSDDTFGTTRGDELESMLAHHGLRRVT